MAKILVVEDEAALLEALAIALEGEKLTVLQAKDGEEGLKKAQKEKPDLILLDIVMPKMDGLTVMQKLQADPKTKSIPIIFLTNLSDVETISKVVKQGMFDYLVKADWDIEDLVALVKKKLRK